jgi:hypothetical protein
MQSIVFSLWNMALIANCDPLGIDDPFAPLEELAFGKLITGRKRMVWFVVWIAANEAERAGLADQLQTVAKLALMIKGGKHSVRSLALGILGLLEKWSRMVSRNTWLGIRKRSE